MYDNKVADPEYGVQESVLALLIGDNHFAMKPNTILNDIDFDNMSRGGREFSRKHTNKSNHVKHSIARNEVLEMIANEIQLDH